MHSIFNLWIGHFSIKLYSIYKCISDLGNYGSCLILLLVIISVYNWTNEVNFKKKKNLNIVTSGKTFKLFYDKSNFNNWGLVNTSEGKIFKFFSLWSIYVIYKNFLIINFGDFTEIRSLLSHGDFHESSKSSFLKTKLDLIS